MIATKLGANIIGNVIPIATASTSLYKAPNENMLGRKLQLMSMARQNGLKGLLILMMALQENTVFIFM